MAVRTQKDPDAYRTISEISEELNVPQHVLRFWETKFDQVQPLKRNGRRRYYRPEDRILLTGIRDLLYGEGYTIRGVQKLLADGITSPASLKARNANQPREQKIYSRLPSMEPLPEPPERMTKNDAAKFRLKVARARLAALVDALA